jgi:hypothetical protein
LEKSQKESPDSKEISDKIRKISEKKKRVEDLIEREANPRKEVMDERNGNILSRYGIAISTMKFLVNFVASSFICIYIYFFKGKGTFGSVYSAGNKTGDLYSLIIKLSIVSKIHCELVAIKMQSSTKYTSGYKEVSLMGYHINII